MTQFINTNDVCAETGLTEPALRHVLRRPGAPRPPLHPTARIFLWTRQDIARLRQFLKTAPAPESSATRQEVQDV